MAGPVVKTYQDFRPEFEAMLDPAKWPIHWLDKQISRGEATAFCADNACIIAALRQFPGGAIEVHGLCACGDLSAIKALIVQAEEWGMASGATIATIASRRGWVRALSSDGYAETQVMIEKGLS